MLMVHSLLSNFLSVVISHTNFAMFLVFVASVLLSMAYTNVGFYILLSSTLALC